jgi:signal transduction histidine kinase
VSRFLELGVPRRLPSVMASLAYLSATAGLVLAVPAARAGLGSLYITDFLIAVSFTTIGLLVASRRPRDRIGLLFLAIGLLEGITVAANHYAIAGLSASEPLPGTMWAAWLGYWVVSLVVPVGLFLTLLLLFPDGRPMSRRWGWVAVGGIVFSVLFALAEIFTLPRLEVTGGLPMIDNPTNVVSLSIAENVWLFGMALLATGMVGVVIRFRRSAGEERQQLRWFVFAVAASIGSMALLVVAFFAIGAPEPEPAWFTVAVTVIPAVGIGVGVPAACGIAVLRYRLWDLDVVIRKTVLYVTVALMLMVVFAVVAAGVGAVVGGSGSAAVVAAALAGFAFWPALRLARRVADRLVYGRRATPYEVLTEFSERMGEAFATDDVLARMAQILGEGTGGTVARVWLKVGTELIPAAAHPAGAERPAIIGVITDDELPSLPGDATVEVRDRGELLGALSVDMPPDEPIDPAKERLVRDLASQAGLVLRNVRLVEDLRQSRRRLVAARDEERRKLERNIHDGAQQQLVALAVKARLARALTDRDPRKAAEMLDQIERETQSALEDLRDLARGIYPPLLADKGLHAALSAQARKSPVPVEVVAREVDRFPQEVEAAVYFSALEALQNTAKYAHASRATITLLRANGSLAFTIADDGDGFDPNSTGYGTGLQGIADRLGALDGGLEVTSRPGSGTTVTGRVPVGADPRDEGEDTA